MWAWGYSCICDHDREQTLVALTHLGSIRTITSNVKLNSEKMFENVEMQKNLSDLENSKKMSFIFSNEISSCYHSVNHIYQIFHLTLK